MKNTKTRKKDAGLICEFNKDWRSDNIKIRKAGGQTNRNFIVWHKGRRFFVRLPWERADIINRETEGKNILALADSKKSGKVLPRYYIYVFRRKNILQPKGKDIFNLPDGAILAEYVDGEPLTMELFRKKQVREKIAKTIYFLHNSGVEFENKYNVFLNEIKKYRLAAQKHPVGRVVGRSILEKLKKLEAKADENISNLKKGVATHNDLIFQNFLIGKDGKVYLLDFEYAGQNKKGGISYDFGFLFADNLFRKPAINKELFEEFLKEADKIYKKRLNREEIYWSAIAAVLVMFWWGLVRYFSVRDKKERTYFKQYALSRAEGIEFLEKIAKKSKRKKG